ncbi:MAG TPA: ATP phosphoribosyltransferase regulatory subunit, partial [Longimicrobiaceae bacterium]|nr:ATP phosphoribosyltransferase regulatory subunit [Longimicrobiaceae bacterium]
VRGLRRIVETVEESAGGRFGIELDPTLARGMGYYTGPIFEIRYQDSASSIAGGGRYDRMVGKLLGRDVPATGFSIGFERVISLLMEAPPREADEEGRVALVFDGETPHLASIIGHARDLRAQGHTVLLEVRSRRGGRQLQDLESRGFTRIGVVGPDGAIEWRGAGARPRGESS